MVMQVKEGLQEQTSDESIIWQIQASNWASAPATPVVDQVVDESAGTDVKSTVMPSGSPSIVETTKIQLPALTALTAGKTYRIEVTFSDGSNTLECYFRVRCNF